VAAERDEFPEPLARLRNSVGTGNSNNVEALGARIRDEQRLRCVGRQKSRSA
jgi:hypothetical protein